VKIVVKPLRMEDGAMFKVERFALKSRLSLTIQIWNGSTRRCGIEVSPTATLKEIVEQAQYKIDDEPLEEAHNYAILHNGTPASQPWRISGAAKYPAGARPSKCYYYYYAGSEDCPRAHGRPEGFVIRQPVCRVKKETSP
jgi:hypothetical protein